MKASAKSEIKPIRLDVSESIDLIVSLLVGVDEKNRLYDSFANRVGIMSPPGEAHSVLEILKNPNTQSINNSITKNYDLPRYIKDNSGNGLSEKTITTYRDPDKAPTAIKGPSQAKIQHTISRYLDLIILLDWLSKRKKREEYDIVISTIRQELLLDAMNDGNLIIALANSAYANDIRDKIASLINVGPLIKNSPSKKAKVSYRFFAFVPSSFLDESKAIIGALQQRGFDIESRKYSSFGNNGAALKFAIGIPSLTACQVFFGLNAAETANSTTTHAKNSFFTHTNNLETIIDKVYAILNNGKELKDMLKQIRIIDDYFAPPRVNICSFIPREPICGRAWLMEYIAEWLNDNDGGQLCVIYGPPGVGKSVFVSSLAMANPNVVAFIPFSTTQRTTRYGFNELVSEIAFQASCHSSDYRTKLTEELARPEQTLFTNRAKAIIDFDNQIARLVEETESNLNELILIDGIDECTNEELLAVAQLVKASRKSTLRLLLTARPEASKKLKARGVVPDVEISIHKESANNIDDVVNYVKGEIGRREFYTKMEDAIALDIAEKSRGIFLYAEKIIDGIELGIFSLTDSKSYPLTLSAVFYCWFERAFPRDIDLDEYKDRWRLPIGAIIASPEPLPIKELELLFGLKKADINDLMLRLGSLVEITDEDTVAFSHRYISDWLCGEDAGCFRVFIDDSVKAMARKCYEISRIHPSKLTAYEACSMFKLMDDSNMVEEYNECWSDPELSSAIQRIAEESYFINRERNRAIRLFNVALEMLDDLNTNNPGQFTNELAQLHYHLGLLSNDVNSAIKSFQISVGLWKDSPRLEGTSKALAGALADYARLLNKQENLPLEQSNAALNSITEAIAIARKGLSDNFEHFNLLLAVMLPIYADVLESKGELGLAYDSLMEAAERACSYTYADPKLAGKKTVEYASVLLVLANFLTRHEYDVVNRIIRVRPKHEDPGIIYLEAIDICRQAAEVNQLDAMEYYPQILADYAVYLSKNGNHSQALHHIALALNAYHEYQLQDPFIRSRLINCFAFIIRDKFDITPCANSPFVP